MTVLAATTPVPQPHEAIGVVNADAATRTLTVRLSDLASGYTRLLWREAYRALRKSEEAGVHGQAPVWASTPDARQAAFATPGDPGFGGMLRFAFSAEAYSKLIGSPGLTASVWIDRGSHRFINVNFKNGRRSA